MMYFRPYSFWADKQFYGGCVPRSGGFSLLPLRGMAHVSPDPRKRWVCSRALGKQQDKKWAFLRVLHIFSWTLRHQISFLSIKSKFTVFYFKSSERSPNPLFPPIFSVSWWLFFLFLWKTEAIRKELPPTPAPTWPPPCICATPFLPSTPAPDPSLPSCSGMFLWHLSGTVTIPLVGSFP